MSLTKFFAAYSNTGRKLDTSTDKAELQRLYPNALILPLVR